METNLNYAERIAAVNYGKMPAITPDDDIRTFTAEISKISRINNWERMAVSTAQGGAAVTYGYHGGAFDGRYVYYSPWKSYTFVRFDTRGLFKNASNWSTCSMTTVLGALVDFAFRDDVFDGRYVYYTPAGSDSFLRYDTTKSFTTAASWEKMNVSTAVGGNDSNDNYMGCTYDGKYVYYSPMTANSFVRFNTQGTSFTTVGYWETINMSTAQGGAILDAAYYNAAFDGRYVYFAPYSSDTFLRFDTLGTSFTTAADWQKCMMSTAQGYEAIDYAYSDVGVDSSYIWFAPYFSRTLVRFNASSSFTAAASWQRKQSVAIDRAFIGAEFDGRYIYFTPSNANTFSKFDTVNLTFEYISKAICGGLVDEAFAGAITDGKYIYFIPSAALTFVRVLASNTNWLQGGQ